MAEYLSPFLSLLENTRVCMKGFHTDVYRRRLRTALTVPAAPGTGRPQPRTARPSPRTAPLQRGAGPARPASPAPGLTVRCCPRAAAMSAGAPRWCVFL